VTPRRTHSPSSGASHRHGPTEAAPRATLVAADIIELDLPAAGADAVVAFYAFGHLPPEAHRPVLTKAVSWLRPGGLLVINVPISAGEGIEPDWLGVPMYFGGIGTQATFDTLTEAGLIVERAETVEEDEHGSIVRFLWIVGATPS
jgi:SAM-dependent methyltransferase